jgi:hypothetical protein
LAFDTATRATIDVLVALEALFCDDDTGYFRAFPKSDFKSRLRVLFNLTDEQLAAVETTMRGNKTAIGSLRKLTDFLINYVFSYVKCFDASRPMFDAQHYYMEREWRVAGNVLFKLDDVWRVFLPQKYAAQFRKDLPLYVGQLTFLG